MATSLPPIRIAVRPSEVPADLNVIVDLRDGQPGHAPSMTTIAHLDPPPARNHVTAAPPPTPPRANGGGQPYPRSFAPRETIPAGFQRITSNLLDRAIKSLSKDRGPTDRDVHKARKSMRRARGVMRLVRDGLGPAYRAENDNLRDTARLLSTVRSSAVAGAALQSLLADFGPLLTDGIYTDLADKLEERHVDISRRTLDNRLLLAGVTSNLRNARARIAAFPTSPASDFGYHGPLIPNDSDLFVRGISRTYLRGLNAMKEAAANPFPEQLHEWRKRVRYLRYQMEALKPAWPEVMAGLCTSLDDLSETLGQERDLWELAETVRTEPELCPDPAARSLLSALTLEQRHAMREQSFRIGTRVYVEQPDDFAHRIQSYWDAWSPSSIPMQP